MNNDGNQLDIFQETYTKQNEDNRKECQPGGSDEGEELIRQRNVLIKELSKRIRTTDTGRSDIDKESTGVLLPVHDAE